MKYTRGPWKWDEQNNWVRLGNGCVIPFAKDTKADGILVAAAPEIYEALKEVEYSTVLDLDGDYISCCPICDVWAGEEHKDYCEIGNALSKAEGRTSR